ncbi:DUF5689 domain-containing protein [Sinomicrobium sp. M5D2P9]
MEKIKKYTVIVLMVLQWACVNSTYDNPATGCEEKELEPNITFAEVKQLYEDEVMLIHEDLVVEGYVISSDKTGNFYGTLHIQDRPEHPQEGFQIDLDLRDYHLLYSIGKKIRIRLKGLYLGKSQGVLKVGGVFTNAGGTLSVGRLPASKVHDHIFVSCEDAVDIIPEITLVNELEDKMINTLVRLPGMEISPEDMCQPYAVAGESGTDRILRNCNGEEIVLRNSGYADFQSEILPSGNGTITAVLGKYSNKYQLTIRDTDDLDFNDERCGEIVYSCDPVGADATIAYVRTMYKGKTVEISENIKITATVISDREAGNTSEVNAVIEDDTAGIVCSFTSGHTLNPGDKVELSLSNTSLEKTNGLLYIKDIPLENIVSAESGHLPEPENIMLSDDLKTYESRLVRMDNVQFETLGVTYSGIRIITDCTDAVKVFTREEASFSGETVNDGKGSITGIVSVYQDEYGLVPRNPDDLDFTEPYEDCLGGTNLMITEYVEGSSYNKFIEIYNATDVDIDMDGYVLARDDNGDGNFERFTMELSGIIPPGGILVYANPRYDEILYADEIANTSGSALGFNGNDQVVLMKNGIIIDHIGIPGDENWGMDKTFRRKTEVIKPNTSYDENEWEEYPKNDVSGLGVR